MTLRFNDVTDVSRIFRRVRLHTARIFQNTDRSRTTFPPEEEHGFSLRNIVGFKPDTMDNLHYITFVYFLYTSLWVR
jgi:hypothetical protein